MLGLRRVPRRVGLRLLLLAVPLVVRGRLRLVLRR